VLSLVVTVHTTILALLLPSDAGVLAGLVPYVSNDMGKPPLRGWIDSGAARIPYTAKPRSASP
jgi:hypothetical protein